MSLIEIKNHMSKARMASLGSLCAIFNSEPDTLRCMLSHWVAKGKIRQCPRQPACATKCFKCPSTTTEIYEWV